MLLFRPGSLLILLTIILNPLPLTPSLISLLLKDHLTTVKERTAWSNDKWPNLTPHQNHCWAKGRNASLSTHTASNAIAKTWDMIAAIAHTWGPAGIAEALTIVTTSVPFLTSPAPLPSALSHYIISTWALSAPPPFLPEITPMSPVLLLETMTEILKGMSLTEPHESASLGGALCYDPQTYRAPIFYFPRALFSY